MATTTRERREARAAELIAELVSLVSYEEAISALARAAVDSSVVGHRELGYGVADAVAAWEEENAE